MTLGRMRFGLFRKQTPSPWKAEYNELANYNAERSRAAGAMYRWDAPPDERRRDQMRSQARLDRLTPEYIERMAGIQADYNENYLGMAARQRKPA